MNEQWSCAGICVEPQSEQRSLGTNQQPTAGTHTLPGTDRTTPAASIPTAATPTNFPSCSSPSSFSQPDCASGDTSLLLSSAVDNCISAPYHTVALNKVEEQKSSSWNYETSSSASTGDILLSSSSGTLTDETYPSTSTAGINIFDEKATLQDSQFSRIIRRRCRFLLPSNISHKLLRIALKQPTTLKHLSITSVKVGESDSLPVVVNNATINLLSIYPNADSGMNFLADVPVGSSATSRAHIYDSCQSDNSRHETTPSTSSGHVLPSERKFVMNNNVCQTAVGMQDYAKTAIGQSNATAVVTSVKQQQSRSASDTSSPLLVNLLRSSSPVANAGTHNVHIQHTHVSHPSAASTVQHISAPSPHTQGNAGYSSYPYMGQNAVNAVQPGRIRPEASHLATSTHGHTEQQQTQSAAHEVSMERHQQIVAPQQHNAPSQQLPQTYYPQYNQRRPVFAGFALRGQIPQQQPAVYVHQQGQMIPYHYIHVQQQSRLSGQPVHFHQAVSLEQNIGTAGNQLPIAAPPPKKRKRPTKKQLKEAEIAQQAVVVAAAQQQFMMEQQMNSRVPSANAHTVDRPSAMSQVIHSSQPTVGITYAQHPQGYPPQTLRSPPALSAQTGPIMQNPPNSSFYQQQNVWVPQHQQQIMSQQRSQMMYNSQIQHHWQNNQAQHSRMIYPQPDNVSEMSTGSSGSVHTSPMTSRNASVDYSPASQSSNTMSPLYQQQQPNMIYQQQVNQQAPQPGLTYPHQSSPSQQQVSVPARPQQQTVALQMQEPQQQQAPLFCADQQCLDMQPKSCLPVLQGAGDFEMDELGANIADDCGDYNDLDSIEPMTESSEFGATLMASHQQQMQQRANTQQHVQHQQQQYYGRMLPPQNRYDIQIPVQQQSVGYMRHMCNETQMRQCGFPGTLGLSQQQQHPLPQGYSSPQHQQQTLQGTTNLFMSPSPQPNCSPSPYTPRSSPQKDGNNVTTRQQQQPRHIAVAHQQYAASPLPQQQQHSVRTPLSAPPTVQSQSQPNLTCGRVDDLRSSRSDGETTPRTPTIDSNATSIEYEKDPINSTIDAVVMRALSDQDSLSSTSISNYFRGSRNRLSANTSSTTEQIGTNDRKIIGNNVSTSVRPVNPAKQSGQFQSSQQQTQRLSNTDKNVIGGSGLGSGSSHNGQLAGNSALLLNKITASSQQLSGVGRENLHGVACGGSEMRAALPLYRQQKDQRTGDQRMNKAVEQQHHLANGHESLNMLKERGFGQSCNGMLSLSQPNDDDRRLTCGFASTATVTDAQQLQRSSPRAVGTGRRSRRKADLSLEALSYDDEDEITVPTFDTAQSTYHTSYIKRVSGTGSIVVGCSGSASAQPPFSNISVQSAQNNFSATVARQQQMLKQQPKTS